MSRLFKLICLLRPRHGHTVKVPEPAGYADHYFMQVVAWRLCRNCEFYYWQAIKRMKGE